MEGTCAFNLEQFHIFICKLLWRAWTLFETDLNFNIFIILFYFIFLAFQNIPVVTIARARPPSRLVLDLVGGVNIE